MNLGVITGLIGVILSHFIWNVDESSHGLHINVTALNEQRAPIDEPVYVTIVCGKSAHRYCPFRFRSLQNLVGSLHRSRERDGRTGLPFVHVFGHRLTPPQLHLLHQWRRIYYHDIDMTFPDLLSTNIDGHPICSGKSRTIFTDGTLKQALIRRMLGDYTNVVYVDANYLFDGYVGKLLLDLMQGNGHVKALATSDHLVVEAVRNLEDIEIVPHTIRHSELYAKSPSRDPNARCYILQRIDIAHSHRLHSLPNLTFDDRTIVLGAPTTSRRAKRAEDHPLTNILVPSLVETAKSNPGWKFVLLAAYDVADKFLDDPLPSSIVRESISQTIVGVDNLEVLFIRVVQTKSVAMLWNLLYDLAMANGARYFYMVNDDVTFLNHIWPGVFAKAIDERSGHGIAGPLDNTHGCALLTQIFIGRGHHELFGYLFPPDFHNWWCDNWINRLYERLGRKTCFDNIRIRNGGRKDGSRPRYQACRMIDFTSVLQSHLAKVT